MAEHRPNRANMKILVLNCGSSSVKFSLFEMDDERELLRGQVERIGCSGSRLAVQSQEGSIALAGVSIQDHKRALYMAIVSLKDPDLGALSSLQEIKAVGHRVVHGGSCFSQSVKVDEEVKRRLSGLNDLAPLHNPYSLMGIEAANALLPHAPSIAVFDTAFHQTLPPRAYIYALPYELHEGHGIRRYGFHGTSHRYIMEESSKLIGREARDLRIISCHLGSGSSIAAISGGRSIDTSMGMTPLEGLVMGTRCGDLDPAIVLHLMEKVKLGPSEVQELLYRRSGLLGISGYASDARELEEAAYLDADPDRSRRSLNISHPHHRRSRLALEIFCYRLRKYIGAYAAAMGGLDVLAFTGGIGERSVTIPQDSCAGLELMGIELGPRTDLGEGRHELSAPSSKVRVLVIPANEELMIARDTSRVLGKSRWDSQI
jgi:acetate kinase